MELVLARRLNNRLIELHTHTRGETVGVLRRDGTYDYRPWLGFIDRRQARRLGKPVKLRIARVGFQADIHSDWRDVAQGRHVQGCLTPGGVYAVADWGVRII